MLTILEFKINTILKFNIEKCDYLGIQLGHSFIYLFVQQIFTESPPECGSKGKQTYDNPSSYVVYALEERHQTIKYESIHCDMGPGLNTFPGS